jgi:integrase
MSVHLMENGKYQARIRGSDGFSSTKTFETKAEAKKHEAFLIRQKASGQSVVNIAKHVTFEDFFHEWLKTVEHQATSGWRKMQLGIYKNHVQPILGKKRLASISPQIIAGVLNRMFDKGLGHQTVLHVYSLLKKVFTDAVEFELLAKNPVKKTFRPKVPRKESRYLTLAEVQRLLDHAGDGPYAIAIWLGVYMGLRVGEVQALRWEDLDLERGVIHVRRTYSRLEKVFRDYPKGKKQHSHRLPGPFLELLKEAKKVANTELVVVPVNWKMLEYSNYRRVLKRYCQEAGVSIIATHGLRHSCSEVWMEAGATRDDLRMLYAHGDSSTTDRYIHDRGTRLGKIADVIVLRPKSSKDVPKLQDAGETAAEEASVTSQNPVASPKKGD